MYFQEDKNHSFDRSQDMSFTRVQHIQDAYDERINSLSNQLQIFFNEIEHDDIFKAMKENSLSKEYASQRASELFNEIMKSEQENTIHKLQNELIEYKALNNKLEYEKQKITNSVRDFEEKLRRAEIDKQKILHDYDNIVNRLNHAEIQFDESSKRKEIDLMQKMENNVRRLENSLHESEQKYYAVRKELENMNNSKKTNELLQDEIESLRKELKNYELFSRRQLDELKENYEAKIENISEQLTESEKNKESLKFQFKNYQKQSEELASNQQSVIKSLVDKSKQLKQKIISQKSKLFDYQKISKEHLQTFGNTKENYEKTVIGLEDKIKVMEKEAIFKENEFLNKHQGQITQLQMQYQHMMDTKLAEMQKEVDYQILRGQEHDREVKNLMDIKMKEIERDFILVSTHEKILADKENLLSKKYGKKIEDLGREHDSNQDELKREIIMIRRENESLNENIEALQKSEESLKRELLREKERLGTDLNTKLIRLKESENSRFEVSNELEKAKETIAKLKEDYEGEIKSKNTAEKEIKSLNSTVSDLKLSLNNIKQTLQNTKTQHELTLSEKIDKHQYYQEKEKSQFLEKEIENKSLHISRLEGEINNLQGNLRESKIQRSGDLNLIELEQSRHQETRSQLKELENYSQKLIHEIEIRESEQTELKSVLDNYKEDIRNLGIIIDNKEKEFFAFKQNSLNKEIELRQKHKSTTEKIKKYVKNSIFFLKKQILSISELFQHEYSSINKNFSTVFQEISIKIIEMQLEFRKELDIKSDAFTSDIKVYYRSKYNQLEDYISSENIHWSDPDTEGIRRAVKSIIEKKNIAQIEIKSLRDSLTSLTGQNENLYRENQKLQIRLHANNEAFDQLQREVSEEANKIKIRLETTGNKERVDIGNRGNYYRS